MGFGGYTQTIAGTPLVITVIRKEKMICCSRHVDILWLQYICANQGFFKFKNIQVPFDAVLLCMVNMIAYWAAHLVPKRILSGQEPNFSLYYFC